MSRQSAEVRGAVKVVFHIAADLAKIRNGNLNKENTYPLERTQRYLHYKANTQISRAEDAQMATAFTLSSTLAAMLRCHQFFESR